ncbi:uncharacterized protein F4822DRAFT_388123 [Hypoxylon trugodes]|uniref:uncharacterized protein n=1 Tax=Hypoxylon trugodes TaxID=326681 RepID=UPI0021A1902E|nr:uncharacterized protein F4822DRAFT_388123 [Hypoxylon trugodes]KAI1394418.1 hypothetical protein F4822DRAFT_388123 [Hypoxylon trugodes]
MVIYPLPSAPVELVKTCRRSAASRRPLTFLYFIVMIGDILDDEDHTFVPILKAIDFERAGVLPDPESNNPGVNLNIFQIGLVMRTLIVPEDEFESVSAARAVVDIRGTQTEIETHAALPDREYPNLDPDIAQLVRRCCAEEDQYRPSLESLHRLISDAVRSRGAKSYELFPRGEYETDDVIRQLVQRLILDAYVGEDDNWMPDII